MSRVYRNAFGSLAISPNTEKQHGKNLLWVTTAIAGCLGYFLVSPAYQQPSGQGPQGVPAGTNLATGQWLMFPFCNLNLTLPWAHDVTSNMRFST